MNYGINQLHNSTIVDNIGGGVVTFNGSSPGHQIYNTIVYYNQPNNHVHLGGSYHIQYSCIDPLPIGVSNTDNLPLFVNQDGNDYRLSSVSSLIDRGRNIEWLKNFSDLSLNERVIVMPDLGCYEFNSFPYIGNNTRFNNVIIGDNWRLRSATTNLFIEFHNGTNWININTFNP